MILEFADTTNGLDVRECGDIGVTTKLSTSGLIIGPPEDKEYAVDPVGVAIIKPSAL